MNALVTLIVLLVVPFALIYGIGFLIDWRTNKTEARKLLQRKEEDHATREILRVVREEAAYQVSTFYLQIMLAGTDLEPLLKLGSAKSDELYYELDEEKRKVLRSEIEQIQAQLKEGITKLNEFKEPPQETKGERMTALVEGIPDMPEPPWSPSESQ